MIYAIDFDGTIVEDKFPAVGALKPEAERFIRELKRRGDKWILFTMREDEVLQDALEFLAIHDLSPDVVNDNLPEMCALHKNNPRKVFADVYIDDHNAGGLLFPDSSELHSVEEPSNVPEAKFELTDETITVEDHILHRIRALKDNPVAGVRVGDLGGFVETMRNLQEDAWVAGDACVFGNARVWGYAWVNGNARISGDARVTGYARVCGDAVVCGDAMVYGDAIVSGDACVYGNAHVFCHAHVTDHARVYGHARVYDNARICGDALVYGRAKVCGNAEVFGHAQVSGDARVQNTSDYIVFKYWWSSGRHFTWTRSNNMWRVGCFYGTGEALIKKAYEDSEVLGQGYERVVEYVEKLRGLEGGK